MNGKQNCLFVFLIQLVMLTGCYSDDDYYTLGTWRRKADLTGVARGYASSFTIGDKGYLCCGKREDSRGYLKDLWCYDFAGDYWTQCASLPDEAEARHSATAFALSGKGYLTTGQRKEGELRYLADTWEYDPQTDSWLPKDDFAGTARYGAISFVLGGYGYVGTGYDGGWLKDFYRFDPSAPTGSQWTVVNGFGGFKRVYGSAFVIDNYAYILCGEQNGSLPEDFWRFDGQTFTRLRDIANTNGNEDYDDDYAITRYAAVTFVQDGVAYLATGNRLGVTSDYWMYHPETDLWYGDSDDEFTPLTEADSGGTPRYGSAAFCNGQRLFLLTGVSGNIYMDNMYELDPHAHEEAD